MNKPLLDLTNSLNWNSAFRRELQSTPGTEPNSYNPIPRQNFLCPSSLMLVGCSSTKARENWWLGCRVSVNLSLGSFDSTSEFTGVTEIYRSNVGLRQLKLLQWKAYDPKPYIILLTVPYWLEQLTVEAWWYDGEINDSYEQALKDLRTSLGVPNVPGTDPGSDNSFLGF